MVDRPDRLGFAPKARQQARVTGQRSVQDLHSDAHLAQVFAGGLVHRAHATGAEQSAHAVATGQQRAGPRLALVGRAGTRPLPFTRAVVLEDFLGVGSLSAQLDGASRARAELVERDRFDQVLERAVFDRLHRRVQVRRTGDEQHR